MAIGETTIRTTSVAALTSRDRARHVISDSPITGPVITLVLLTVVSSILVENFFTMRTFSGIVTASTITGVVCIGVTLLMISGEFDLSVGPMLAAGSYLFAMNVRDGGNPFVAIVLALVVTGVLGSLNGLVRVKTNIPSFIVTLGTRSIYKSVVWVIAGGALIQSQERLRVFDVFNGRADVINDAIRSAFGWLNGLFGWFNDAFLRIQETVGLTDKLEAGQQRAELDFFRGTNFRWAVLWFIGLVIVFQFILNRTRFGNQIYAVGGNAAAAAAQGVNVRRTRVCVFAIVGLLCGVAGILDFSQFGAVRVSTGAGIELTAIAAAVIGGTRLQGGQGSVVGALVGVLIINTLRTAVVLLGFPADNFEAIVGVCIVGAVIINNFLRSRF